MNILGSNIRRLRLALGDSQAAFGARFGLTRAQIASYEGEEKYSSPTVETLIQIVDNFYIDLRAFVSDASLEFTPDGKVKGKVEGKPNALVQNEKDKKTETEISPVSTVPGVSMISPERAYVTGADLHVRSIVVAVDEDNDERVILVGEPVYAGYQRGYADPSFVSTLPTIKLPGISGRTYRAFEVRGDSMVPTLQPNDIIVCSYVDDWRVIRNDEVYVVVSPTEGLVVKRLTNRIEHRPRPHVICTSDNASEYKPFTLPATPDHISEMWQVEMRLTRNLAPPPPAPELATRVTVLEMQYQNLMERLQSPQSVGKGVFFDD